MWRAGIHLFIQPQLLKTKGILGVNNEHFPFQPLMVTPEWRVTTTSSQGDRWRDSPRWALRPSPRARAPSTWVPRARRVTWRWRAWACPPCRPCPPPPSPRTPPPCTRTLRQPPWYFAQHSETCEAEHWKQWKSSNASYFSIYSNLLQNI